MRHDIGLLADPEAQCRVSSTACFRYIRGSTFALQQCYSGSAALFERSCTGTHGWLGCPSHLSRPRLPRQLGPAGSGPFVVLAQAILGANPFCGVLLPLL